MPARTHGLSNTPEGKPTPEYKAWMNMLTRCRNPRTPYFKNYGGRGVTVADEWVGGDGFVRFREHVGERPTPKHSLDRIDNARGYEPGNVCWADWRHQSRNKRSTKLITVHGETLCVSDAATKYGVNKTTLAYRLARGMDPEIAVTTGGK